MTLRGISKAAAIVVACIFGFGCWEENLTIGSGSTIGIENQHSDSKLIMLKNGGLASSFALSEFFVSSNGSSVFRSLPDIQTLFIGDDYIGFVVWNFSGNADTKGGRLYFSRRKKDWCRNFLQTIEMKNRSLFPFQGKWVGVREDGKIFEVILDNKNDRLLVKDVESLNEIQWEEALPNKGWNSFLTKSKSDEWFEISMNCRGEFQKEKIDLAGGEFREPRFTGLELFLKEYSRNGNFRGMPLIGAFFDQNSQMWILTTTSNDMTDTIYLFDPVSGKSKRIVEGYFSRWYPLPFSNSISKTTATIAPDVPKNLQ